MKIEAVAMVLPAVGLANVLQDGGWATVSNLSASGLLCWYLWYTVARVMPRVMKAHQQTISELTEHYETVLNKRDDQLAKLTEVIRGLACHGQDRVSGL